jgi:hypothetical protein
MSEVDHITGSIRAERIKDENTLEKLEEEIGFLNQKITQLQQNISQQG